MAKRTRGLITALDIGSSKVACFITRIISGQPPEIIGIGHHASHGIRAGVITNMKEAELSIRSAVSAAESMAGINIDRVVVNISGQLSSSLMQMGMDVLGKPVSGRDIYRLAEQAYIQAEEHGDKVVYCLPVDYAMDGMAGIKDPAGMHGGRLQGTYHTVTVPAVILTNLVQCLARCHLDVEEFVPSAYASALACLNEDERELGVIVMDIGGGSTSLAVFRNGRFLFTDVLPVGGGHISNDIALGLSTSVPNAERIKALHGNTLGSTRDEKNFIEVTQINSGGETESASIPLSTLVGIIRPRVEEMFELARKRLEKAGYSPMAMPIVLTGSASQLPGLKEFASELFRRPVRLGVPHLLKGMAESTQGPAFSTCVGLLDYSQAKQQEAERQRQRYAGVKGVLSRVLHWIEAA